MPNASQPFDRLPKAADRHPAVLSADGQVRDPKAFIVYIELLRRTVWHLDGSIQKDRYGVPRVVPYNHAAASYRELVQATGFPKRTVERIIARFIATGAVASHASEKGTTYEWLSPDLCPCADDRGTQNGTHTADLHRDTCDASHITINGAYPLVRVPCSELATRPLDPASRDTVTRASHRDAGTARIDTDNGTQNGTQPAPTPFIKIDRDRLSLSSGVREEHQPCQNEQTNKQDFEIMPAIDLELIRSLVEAANAHDPTIQTDLPSVAKFTAAMEACSYIADRDTAATFVADIIAGFDNPIHATKFDPEHNPQWRSLRFACQTHRRPPHRPHAHWILGLEQRERDADAAADAAEAATAGPSSVDESAPLADRRDLPAVNLWRDTITAIRTSKRVRRELGAILDRVTPVRLAEDTGRPLLELTVDEPDHLSRLIPFHGTIEHHARQIAGSPILQVQIAISADSEAKRLWSRLIDEVRTALAQDVIATLDLARPSLRAPIGEQPAVLTLTVDSGNQRSVIVHKALTLLYEPAERIHGDAILVDVIVDDPAYRRRPAGRL